MLYSAGRLGSRLLLQEMESSTQWESIGNVSLDIKGQDVGRGAMLRPL